MIVDEQRTLQLLNAHREKLSVDLGFAVTPDQHFYWLLKQVGFDTSLPPVVDYLGYVMPSRRLSQNEVEQCKDFMRGSRKIDAIRLMRTVTLLGLREAKEVVEKNWEAIYGEAR